jgi:hypothetical protein
MPNNKGKRRRFGSARKTPLGEFRASYLGPDRKRYFAPHRFKRERDADRWLAAAEALITAGDWTNPERARVSLAEYAEQWISQRLRSRPSTAVFRRCARGPWSCTGGCCVATSPRRSAVYSSATSPRRSFGSGGRTC